MNTKQTRQMRPRTRGPARLAITAALAVAAVSAWAQLPAPIISVGLDEGSGTTATNRGSAGGTLTVSVPVPTWANNTPPRAGSAGNWADNTATVTVGGDVSTVELPATGPSQYFRLRNK